ncbi:hypothetical protein Sjap_008131 [Stephania japonica]|uniref:Uncharacterized protein n=1 Tax=Stephania japonica TaxID=461633 RepID=A0AAP0JR98_9MAGN
MSSNACEEDEFGEGLFEDVLERCSSGLVTDEDIKRGEFVTEYAGEGLFNLVQIKNATAVLEATDKKGMELECELIMESTTKMVGRTIWPQGNKTTPVTTDPPADKSTVEVPLTGGAAVDTRRSWGMVGSFSNIIAAVTSGAGGWTTAPGRLSGTKSCSC